MVRVDPLRSRLCWARPQPQCHEPRAHLLYGSATAAAIFKITTLKALTCNDDFTCKIQISNIRLRHYWSSSLNYVPDQMFKTIIPTVVEANTIMIAASISTLHPVYELIRRKLTGRMANDGGDATQRQHHNASDTPQGAKMGFWSVLMGVCLRTDSNTFVSRPNRSHSHSHSRRVPVSTRANDEMTQVPIRTLEDARDNRGPDGGPRREGRADKTLVRLYHAGLGSEASRSVP